MNRKGQRRILWNIGELGAIILVGILAFMLVRNLADQQTTAKVHLAADMQMMVNVLAGIPGNALVRYPENVSSFSVVLGSGNAAVFTKGEDKTKWITRHFYLPKGFTATGSFQGSEQLCVEKKGKTIRLKRCAENE